MGYASEDNPLERATAEHPGALEGSGERAEAERQKAIARLEQEFEQVKQRCESGSERDCARVHAVGERIRVLRGIEQ